MNTHAALAEYLRLDRAHAVAVDVLASAKARNRALTDAAQMLARIVAMLKSEPALSDADGLAVVESVRDANGAAATLAHAAHTDLRRLEHAELDAREARDAWAIVHGIDAEVAT